MQGSDQSPTSSASAASSRRDLTEERRLAGLLARLDVTRRLAEHRSPLGVAEGRLLWLLSDRRPRTLREIGEALQLEQSTVNRQVNGALSAHRVRRIEEPGRSARLIAPTDEGLSALEAASGLAFGACREGLAALGGDSRVEEFLEQLSTFVDAYGEALDAGSPT